MVRTLITRVMTASVDLELERYTAAKKMSAVVIWFLKENEARLIGKVCHIMIAKEMAL